MRIRARSGCPERRSRASRRSRRRCGGWRRGTCRWMAAVPRSAAMAGAHGRIAPFGVGEERRPAGDVGSASSARRRSSVSGWLENSARAREKSSSPATRSSRSSEAADVEAEPAGGAAPAKSSACASSCAREAVVDQRRAERAGDREPGHVAEDEADEQAGGRAGDQGLHAVAVVDVAELVGEDAGEFIGRAARLEQGGEIVGAAAGQREGVGDVGADDRDVGGEGRAEAVERRGRRSGRWRVLATLSGSGSQTHEALAAGQRRFDLRRGGVADLASPRRAARGRRAARRAAGCRRDRQRSPKPARRWRAR